MINPTGLTFVSAIDRNYVLPYAVLLASFRKTNPDTAATAYLMHLDLRADDLAFIQTVADRFEVKLEAIALPLYPFALFSTRRRMSPVAFAKAFTSRYVPTNINRVLLVDADIVVADDMIAAAHMGFGAPLAAVCDLPGSTHEHFNTGLVIADLSAWRREGVAEVAERFLLEYSDALHTHDQHVLNLIFKGRWDRLPLEWNWMEAYHRRSVSAEAYTIEEIEKARAHPILVHFACKSDKPWRTPCTNPRAHLYHHYCRIVGDLCKKFQICAPGHS